MLKNNGFHNRHSPILRAFSPLSLFSGGAPGAWYDPSDLTTLFQDSAGTTPVTSVEQPVGLMLDKSQGLVLGSEILTNGTFESSIAGWTAGAGSAAWVAGTAQITGSAGVIARLYQGMTLTAGKWYLMTATCVSTTDASATLEFLGGSVSTTFTSGQTKNLYFTPASTGTFYAQVRNTNAGAVVSAFDNISVKELPGNHAFQATSASRPVLSARYNLLTKTEQFDDAVWTKTGATVTPNDITAPDGTLTADKVVFSGGTSEIFQAAGAGGSGALEAVGAVWVKGTAGETVQIYDAYTPRTPTTLTGNWQRLSVPVTGSIRYLDISAANGATARTIWLWGADLKPSNQSTLPYQRVNTATDYATTGFLPYLKFDGVDDSLSTNSISFTSTDKMSVFAGVRIITNAATGVLAELSSAVASNSGSFTVMSPDFSAWRLYLNGGGNLATAFSTAVAPTTAVQTGLFDIAGTPEVALLLNGIQTNTGNGGATGNFGNYPLFIGRRGSSSLPFNGQIYSLIIVGKAVTAGELTSTETYVATKTGVTL